MSIEPCPCIARWSNRNPDPDAPVAMLFSQEEIANFSPREQEQIHKLTAERRAKIAAHESGHCVISTCFGRSALRATIDFNGASARLAGQPESVLAFMLGSVAGDACGTVLGNCLWRPCWNMLRTYIERAHDAAALGICDRCFEARVLTTVRQNSTNEELVGAWREAFEICYALLADDEIRGCAGAVAQELQEKTTIARREIERIVAKYRLREASREVLSSLNPRCFPSWVQDLPGCA